jgi:ABC-type branched-subunit amino acid transport system substrate-binding protein
MKSKIIVISVIVVFLVFVLIGINKKTTPGEIRVGVIAPLSGEYGSLGESMVNAVIMNGENDPRIKLFIEDSKFDPKIGLTAYQKLTSINHIDVLINLDSVTLEAITPLIKESKLPVIQIFEAHDHFDDTVFQMLPFSYPVFTKLGEISSKKYSKIAVVYSAISDLYTINADYFKKGFSTTTKSVDIKIGKSSYIRSDVTKMLSENPDAFSLILPSSDGIKFLKEFRDQKGSRKISLICDANIEIALDEYIKALGPDLFEGCLSTNLPVSMSESFKTEYKKRFNSDPIMGADWGYDSITIIKGLINQPKNAWISTIASTSIDGASGHVSFDETGTRFGISEAHIFKNGKFVKLED